MHQTPQVNVSAGVKAILVHARQGHGEEPAKDFVGKQARQCDELFAKVSHGLCLHFLQVLQNSLFSLNTYSSINRLSTCCHAVAKCYSNAGNKRPSRGIPLFAVAFGSRAAHLTRDSSQNFRSSGGSAQGGHQAGTGFGGLLAHCLLLPLTYHSSP